MKRGRLNKAFMGWFIVFLLIGIYNMPKENVETENKFYSLTKDRIEIKNILQKGGDEKVDVKFQLEGKDLNLSQKPIGCRNRYYIPVEDLCKNLSKTLDIKDKKILLDNVEIDMSTNKYKVGKEWKELRGEAVLIDNKLYMTLVDLGEILNLKTSWNQKNCTVGMYKNRQGIEVKKPPKKNKKKVFMRLEDVAAGTIYTKNENLEKFRVVGDYLYEQGAKFHIAWIPRYVNPKENIDNDLTRDFSFSNANFLFTLDYLIDRGGVVGLHGYTHQYGQEESIIGSEFQESFNQSPEEQRSRVEKALDTANKLNIPHVFFETPHYRSSEEFQSILEEYFNYVYEPAIGVWNYNVYLSERNHRTKFIPAPLSYVEDKDVDAMIEKIKKKDENLKSFFYHPAKEFEYIKFASSEDGYPYCSYDENSMLHKLVNTIYAEGYNLSSIENSK